MEANGTCSTNLTSLRQLWNRFDSAIDRRVAEPLQHILEKIATALEDAGQWLDSYTSQYDQPLAAHSLSGQNVNESNSTSNLPRDEVLSKSASD